MERKRERGREGEGERGVERERERGRRGEEGIERERERGVYLSVSSHVSLFVFW